jgi:hypothetical protein
VAYEQFIKKNNLSRSGKKYVVPVHSSTDGVEEVKVLNCSLVGGQMFVVIYTQIFYDERVRNNIDK